MLCVMDQAREETERKPKELFCIRIYSSLLGYFLFTGGNEALSGHAYARSKGPEGAKTGGREGRSQSWMCFLVKIRQGIELSPLSVTLA